VEGFSCSHKAHLWYNDSRLENYGDEYAKIPVANNHDSGIGIMTGIIKEDMECQGEDITELNFLARAVKPE